MGPQGSLSNSMHLSSFAKSDVVLRRCGSGPTEKIMRRTGSDLWCRLLQGLSEPTAINLLSHCWPKRSLQMTRLRLNRLSRGERRSSCTHSLVSGTGL
jgi:hypothetical protein